MAELLKIGAVLTLGFILAGCKLAVMVVEGGEVQSTSSGTCVAGSVCVYPVIDTNYSETFTANPYPGWEFVRWNSGGDFQCAKSTNPVCVISNVGAAGIPAIEDIVASDKTFYLMPIFSTLSDTVMADGKEWYQVDLFRNLPWNAINAVCSGGPCSGVLSGRNMNGWTWASTEDINGLFNSYIGSEELGPGLDYVLEIASPWAPAFFSDGWRSTGIHSQHLSVIGYTRDIYGEWGSSGLMRDWFEDSSNDRANTHEAWMNLPEANVGAWFYRTQ